VSPESQISAALDGTFNRWYGGGFRPVPVPLDFMGKYAPQWAPTAEQKKIQSDFGKIGNRVRMETLARMKRHHRQMARLRDS